MAERVFNCPDCGVEVKTKYHRTVRCKECARKHKLEYRREWHQKNGALLMTEEAIARRNNGAFDDREGFHRGDSPEDIQKCLNCQRPKCRNCLGYMYTKKSDRRIKDD